MQLNTLSPAPGSKPSAKRRGRGIGSGLGKTGGRGGKGQTARQGGSVKPGFEGGQMPIQRRLPKFGFTSQKSLRFQEVRLSELNKISADLVDVEALKAAGLLRKDTLSVKVVLSGKLEKPVILKGIPATKGAKAAIEAVGGKVED